MEVGQKKFPFHLRLSAKASAGSNDLAQEQIKDGRLYCIQRVAVENETSAYSNLRILIAGAGDELLLEEVDSPQGGTLYWMTDPVYLRGGQYLVCRLAGCTAGDNIQAYITGWWSPARILEDREGAE